MYTIKSTDTLMLLKKLKTKEVRGLVPKICKGLLVINNKRINNQIKNWVKVLKKSNPTA